MAKKVLIGTFSFQTFTECVWIKEEYIKTDWECGVRGLDSAGLEAQRLYKWVFNSSQTFSRSEAENKFRPIWSLFFLSLFFSFCSSIFLLSLLINVDFSCNFSFANDQPFDSFCVFRSFLNFNLFSVTLYPLFNNFCKYYFIYVSNCQVLLFSLVVIQTSRQMYPSLIILLLLYINL